MKAYVHADKVRLIKSGEDFFSQTRELIRSARESIHLQTYIFSDDAAGRSIVSELAVAAKRNVAVFLLIDAFGSSELPDEFYSELKSYGITVRKFSPLFSGESVYIGRRLHHKIIVADKRRAIVGGINIAEKYKGKKGEKAWLDYAVLIEGDCCSYLHELCRRIYRRRDFGRKKIKTLGGNQGPMLRFRRNDWILGKNEVHRSYREALVMAEKNITIVASYFLPGIVFRRLLRRACKRGVTVRLILAGRSDLSLVRLAERYLYRDLLGAGVKVYEWWDSVMHGKATVIDNVWVSVGSYNINHLSRYRSIELNVDIKDKTLAEALNRDLENSVLSKSLQITPGDLPERAGLLERIKTTMAYFLLRMIWRILVPRRK